MIICICNNVNEKLIKDLVLKGLSDYEIIEYTQAGLGCGTCVKDVKHLIKQIREGNGYGK